MVFRTLTIGVLALSLFAPLCLVGCVERLLFVRSDPQGARVLLDGREVGTTPLEIPFEHYGTREILLRTPEHDSAVRIVKLDPPWYQWFPLDFVAENLWPWTVVDRHELSVVLRPIDLEALEERLDDFEKESFGEHANENPGDPP